MNTAALLLSLVTALTVLPNVQAAAGSPRVLYDSRLRVPEPRLTELERGRIEYVARLAAAKNLWTQGEDPGCSGQDFTVIGAAPGAFTVKGTQQGAYLYTSCFNRTGNFQGLVIVQGSVVVAHYIFIGLLYGLSAVKDINRNGHTELLLEGGFTGQGYTTESVQIAELRPTRRLLGQLDYNHPPEPYTDNCGVQETGGTWNSFVVRVVPGREPTFTQQQVGGGCENELVTTSVGPVKPLILKPAPTGWVSAPLR